ncbi:MAG: FtsW/RodA/SpoVE family cell cycle protein [Provencibacterium sp.]|jgi:rod shape determining protein RodA|nr:FtsW/RodA/SpoVE family cell cycle protein [Provencibacterium sp.]
MPEYESIEQYLKTVEEQIRWKRARPAISLELRQHLEDQRDAFSQAGHPRKEAEALAVKEMGDPAAVGAGLDRIHRPKPQWGLIGLTIALALAGGFLRVLLTSGSEYARSPASAVFALLLGTACLLGGYFLDASFLFCHAKTVYTAALLAGILSLHFSPLLHGIHYYTRYVALLYPTVYAVWVFSCRKRGWRGFFAAIAGGIPLAFICLLAPALSALLTLLVCGFILLLCAIWEDWFRLSRKKAAAAVFAAALLPAAGLLLWLFSRYSHVYLLQRMMRFLRPEQDPLGSGYQTLSIRKALAASRWLGEGNAQLLPDIYERFVPDWSSGSLLTTAIYRLGWLPFLALMLAAAGLALWLLRKCLQQGRQAGGLLALSVVLSLSMQASASLCMNLGFPLFAAEFPLLTGNLHTIIDMGLIGLALSTFRGAAIPFSAKGETRQSDA